MARRASPGNIWKVPLSDGSHTFARELQHPFAAIYDARNLAENDTDRIAKRPVLFVVVVHDSTFREWIKVGSRPVEPEIRIPDRFRQDIADPSNCRIVNADGVERAATIDECEGLEPQAVWETEHIDERIIAYYQGRPSEFVESLKLERP
jgi:hypothetical protein